MSKSDAIRAAKKVDSREVICNEWKPEGMPEDEDFSLFVRSMPGPRRLAFEKAAGKGKFKKNPDLMRKQVLSACVFNDEQFNESTFEGFTIDEITNLLPSPRERLFDAALAISGITNNDVDELVGN